MTSVLANVALSAGAVVLANSSDGVGPEALGGAVSGEMGAIWMADALEEASSALFGFVGISWRLRRVFKTNEETIKTWKENPSTSFEPIFAPSKRKIAGKFMNKCPLQQYRDFI